MPVSESATGEPSSPTYGPPAEAAGAEFASGARVFSVEKGLLAIAGERASSPNTVQGESPRERNVYANERFDGKFRRVIALPEEADPARVEATYRNGVLKVVVPKRESSKPRQIQVSIAG